MEIYLSLLEGTLINTSETVDIQQMHKHFIILPTYFSVCNELKVKATKERSKLSKKNLCYNDYKAGILYLFDKLFLDKHQYKKYPNFIVRQNQDATILKYATYNYSKCFTLEVLKKIFQKIKKTYETAEHWAETNTVNESILEEPEDLEVVSEEIDENSDEDDLEPNYQTVDNSFIVEISFLNEIMLTQMTATND